MLGVVSFFLACLLTIITVFCYLPSLWCKTPLKFGRICYYLSAVGVVIAAGSFLSAILQDDFQYIYVYSHSAANLGFWYKVSVFWAGQEGSFLLWFLFHALIGSWLLYKDRLTAPAFWVYCIIQLMLVIFLLSKNPFVLGMPMSVGAGLNPLLQDFWMVIHPPVVFLGYTAFAVPFSAAMGSLLTKQIDKSWIKTAEIWSIFAWTTLGMGIFMGAYWSYKTLGWGGYWGWDPVENASLVPWLTGAALCHILGYMRKKSTFTHLGYGLSWLTFSLILYGTFLTRSGLLSDFSVHAFEAGKSLVPLAPVIFAIIGFSGLLLAIKWRNLSNIKFEISYKQWGFWLYAGVWILLIIALLVFIGMSTPIFSLLLGQPQNISIDFYNKSLQFPAIVLLLCLTIVSILRWSKNIFQSKKYLLFSIFLSIFSVAIIGIFYKMHQLQYFLWAAIAILAIIVQLKEQAIEKIFVKIAHAGVALLLLGVLFSSTCQIIHKGIVFQHANSNVIIFNQGLRYKKSQDSSDGQGFIHYFSFGKNTMKLESRLDSRGNIGVKHPAILHTITGDYYLADRGKSLSLSFKPLIAFVWLGCILITLGGYWAWLQKVKS
ncbi:cytochrome c biogenesis protein CcsA [Pectinatus brassicae]|uniref:Cytochrome c-type biogenesis protein CcmF n=1 Tax=Pectinatus brassicae TaxID=862415 RepID=A0A840UNN3_9FIRM|nr:cytochrome c biogenesis protein CcsA [Pectinatus brassicae]MBB5336308.1 cytochrome c-type biogenesis protein CcmF [Pectinatus brassicae]